MTNFEELCRSRRSIRKYKALPVEREKLDYMLRCALMSPSGKRINPWEFYVCEDVAVLRSLSACKTYGSQMFDTARAAIAVAADAAKTDTWQADAAIAAEHLLLAAEDQGLGACWCHIYGREESEQIVRTAFGIPDTLTVLCIISIGYKDEERRQYDPAKLLYDKVHYIK